MTHHRIYLSGPISGLTFSETTKWRDDITEELDEYAEILDPMRDVEAPTSNTIVTESLDSADPAMMTDRGIVVRDYTDTTTSTLLIINLLGARKASIGTIAELAWAYHLKIPTIVIMETESYQNVHEHPFVRAMTDYRVDSVDRAVAVAKSIMGVSTSW